MGIEQIIALGTFASSVVVALVGVAVSVRKSRTEAVSAAQAMWSNLCEAQQARLQQLTERINALEDDLTEVRAEAAAQRHENEILRGRVRDLETQIEQLKRERAELMAQLERGE